MKRCIIITGYIEGSLRNICPQLFEPMDPQDMPLILCADGGYRLASREGLLPHVIIGDFDTFDGMDADVPRIREDNSIPGEIIRVPVEKDDTDTMLCIKYGLEQGCDSFLILGGVGGRLDHTFANIQSLAWLASRGKDVVMKDEEHCVTMKVPGSYTIHRHDYRRFSLFSYSASVEGLTVQGAKYDVVNGNLDQTFPLGVSNEFINDIVQIKFNKGMLLIIQNHQR